MNYYEVGDLIIFRPDGEGLAAARIDARVDNLVDGRPGFIARLANDSRTWGLDAEVVDVITEARTATHDMDAAIGEAYRREAARREAAAAPGRPIGLIRQYRVTLVGAPNTQRIVSAISADAARRMVDRMMHNGVMAPAEIVSVDLHEQDH